MRAAASAASESSCRPAAHAGAHVRCLQSPRRAPACLTGNSGPVDGDAGSLNRHQTLKSQDSMCECPHGAHRHREAASLQHQRTGTLLACAAAECSRRSRGPFSYSLNLLTVGAQPAGTLH